MICPDLHPDKVSHMSKSSIIGHERFHTKLITTYPADDPSSYEDVLLIGQRHGHRKGLSDSQWQITGEPPAGQRDVPHRAVAFRETRMIGHRAAQGKAA